MERYSEIILAIKFYVKLDKVNIKVNDKINVNVDIKVFVFVVIKVYLNRVTFARICVIFLSVL